MLEHGVRHKAQHEGARCAALLTSAFAALGFAATLGLVAQAIAPFAPQLNCRTANAMYSSSYREVSCRFRLGSGYSSRDVQLGHACGILERGSRFSLLVWPVLKARMSTWPTRARPRPGRCQVLPARLTLPAR